MYDKFNYNGTRTNYESRTEWFWVTDAVNDYSNFNFDYHVPSWEAEYLHVFGDQWSRDSHTYLVHKDHKEQSAQKYLTNGVTRVGQAQRFHATNMMPNEGPGERLNSNFFNFIKRMVTKTSEDYIWITSSVCDYTDFDFTWHPNIGDDKEFIHTFGDYTFYIPVEEFKQQQQDLVKLEWFFYHKTHESVPTLKTLPINSFNAGVGAADAIKNHTFTHHYEWFVEKGARYKLPSYPKRWDEINIQTFGENKSVMCVPREAKSYIKDQVYDYPNIETNLHDVTNLDSDIVFISYDETNANDNWKKLKDKFPRAKRLQGVKGRTQAYHAAAAMSQTDYFFAVFPTLELEDSFDFTFQPDRLKNPCHYIFHAKNPVIDLEYGHRAVILYNKHLCLSTTHPSLDFTLSQPHTVVPQLCGTSHFNLTPEISWRVAFREVLKLCSMNPTTESKYRLNKWCELGKGTYAQLVQRGALDAVEYYKEVDGNKDALQLSYELDWLKEKFNSMSAVLPT